MKMTNTKTVKLAIIDDGISSKHIPKNQCCEYFIAEDGQVNQCAPEPDISHGTACYLAFRRHTKAPHHLISIKVLNEETGTGAINNLITALQWCEQQNIDVIHMSIGTSRYQDFALVAKAVKTLNNTIIVAACNNNNTLTYSACLPSVIGVRHCCIEWLDGKFAYNLAPYDQIELMTQVKNESNSAAAPVITAYVCSYIADGLVGIDTVRQKLKEDAVKNPLFINYDFYKNILKEWEDIQVPIVTVPEDTLGGIDKVKSIITLFMKDGYRAVCFSLQENTNIEDYIFNLSWPQEQISIQALVELLYNFTLPDIIFLHVNIEEAKKIRDLELIVMDKTDSKEIHHIHDNVRLSIGQSTEDLYRQLLKVLT